MKRLVLIRHAKSSWKNPTLSDHDRPLNKRGQRNLEQMAPHLNQLGLRVDWVFSSSALRAQLTAEALTRVLCPQHPYQTCPELYQFSVEPLWLFIQNAPVELKSMALVGHNPAMMELAEKLLDLDLENLPTCAVMEMELSINRWQDIYRGCASESYRIVPKQLG